jgi:hypothetical protein
MITPMRPPGFLYDGLAAFVDALPDQCVMAEIGTYAGEATAVFLRKAAHITCIDPWVDYLESANAQQVLVGLRHMDQVEAAFDALQARHPDRIRKIKGTGREAATIFPDGTFDVVYLDALHEYLDVVADVQAWLPKVKPGGILAGHDYDIDHPGVPRAVIDTIGVPDAVFPDGSWAKRVGPGPKVAGPAPTLKRTGGPGPKVLIGIPTPVEHAGYTPFNIALEQLLRLHDDVLVFRSMGGVVPGQRNRIVREAIGVGADYIWFLDNDQPFFAHDALEPTRPDDLTALLAHGVDAVVPLSPRRGNPFLPLLFSQIDDEGTYAVQRYLLPDDHGLIPVAAAGMGGLLIKTAVLERMGIDGWFHFQHPSDDFDSYAEDIPFYKKLERVGVQLYCDLEVRFGHAVTTVAYIMRQQGHWVTVLADSAPFVAFAQPQHPLGIAYSEKQRQKVALVPV